MKGLEIDIEMARIFWALIFLSVSSLYDLRSREVPDKVWAVFAPVALALLFFQYYVSQLPVFSLMLSVAVTTGVALALFYFGFFGGADAKALICVSLAVPLYPEASLYKPLLPEYPFPLSVLGNAAVGSSLLILVMIIRNFSELVVGEERIFEGFEEEPFWRKIIVFMTGMRVDVKKLGSGSHYIPLEYFINEANGTVSRHLRLSWSLDEEESGEVGDILRYVEGKVWVTPGLPFIVFITAGFLFALIFGDIITWIIIFFTGL
ncbi:MAG: A24 family peptidase C-terminal domain-containing protein [Nitrososphaerota archaeon]|nr:prepilin peptidase [Candidatus Bathyarchaeota archaeon]MDW8048624.1 A24 family peptidase C-terminal domain-containing protein [Nitrososphaerota archaeon]